MLRTRTGENTDVLREDVKNSKRQHTHPVASDVVMRPVKIVRINCDRIRDQEHAYQVKCDKCNVSAYKPDDLVFNPCRIGDDSSGIKQDGSHRIAGVVDDQFGTIVKEHQRPLHGNRKIEERHPIRNEQCCQVCL